ncbi:DMT family transporter [Actinorugispora endophytica]|uniref:Magnesium transporter NIPA n=1 Tax=Actinorugispora endophytica TaxID=1605990 RepID=A0A4R6USA7_9ACTN|nr:DMT family transporter [Actinorugispora endophytica]TDQ49981.1 hypothetical protein EV190_11425 [Actinorugispora endophytica]
MTWAIVVAVMGAVSFAGGAALQERAAMNAPAIGVSQLRLLRHLARNSGWLLGIGLTVAGFAAHAWALFHAPLTVVQPIGVSGLLFAVVFSALLHKRPLTRKQVVGCVVVTVGLTALLAVLPKPPDHPPPPPRGPLTVPLVSMAVMLGCLAVAGRTSGAVRAWTLALAGGVGFAVTSALARIVGVAALHDPMTLLSPFTLFAVFFGLFGAAVVQNAYRTDHFALAYATILISDPIAAALIGVVMLGESLPSGAFGSTVAVLAVLAVAAGTVSLARSSRPAAPHPGAAGLPQPVRD